MDKALKESVILALHDQKVRKVLEKLVKDVVYEWAEQNPTWRKRVLAITRIEREKDAGINDRVIGAWIMQGPLFQWRKRAHLSQRRAAVMLGVSLSTYAKWEMGVNEPQTRRWTMLRKITDDRDIRATWDRWLSQKPRPPKITGVNHQQGHE